MLPLFQPDIFSTSKPLFSPAPPAVADKVVDALDRIYAGRIVPHGRIEQFGGNEINSNNYRIYSSDAQYLLKRLPGKNLTIALESQLSLFKWLAGRSVGVPEVLENASGELLARDADWCWCMFSYIEGDFFSGGKTQLQSTGYGIGRLLASLTEAPARLQLPQKWEYFTPTDARTFSAVKSCREDWARILGPDLADLLATRWESVTRVARELDASRSELQSSGLGATHCDLHPHNILMKAEEPNFVDFESLVLMPPSSALGYATYKLIRQSAALNNYSVTDSAEIVNSAHSFYSAVAFGMTTPPTSLESLRLFALLELFRRLLIVFRLNFLENNTSWNHVLSMHLSGLDEIDIIFGR